MRFLIFALLSALLPSAVSIAQTGFSTQMYPAVLAPASDNTRLLTADFNGDGKPNLVLFGSRYASYTMRQEHTTSS